MLAASGYQGLKPAPRAPLVFETMTDANIEATRFFPQNPLNPGVNFMMNWGVRLKWPYNRLIPIAVPCSLENWSHNYLFKAGKGNILAASDFFEWFTPSWGWYVQCSLYDHAKMIWEEALGIAERFEKANWRIHKGTAFYFHAISHILNGELENGFLIMHKAVEEDVITSPAGYKDWPAYAFAVMNADKQDQFFREYVRLLAKEVGSRLEAFNRAYRSDTFGGLEYSEFERWFLRIDELEDEAFEFVYFIARLNARRQPSVGLVRREAIEKTSFGSIINADLLFDLCLVVEGAIKVLYDCGNKPLLLKDEIVRMHTDLKQRLEFRLSDPMFQLLDKEFRGKSQQAVESLLAGTFLLPKIEKGLKVEGVTIIPNEVERCLLLTYFLRNFGAHSIERWTLVNDRFNDLVSALLSSLFFVITFTRYRSGYYR